MVREQKIFFPEAINKLKAKDIEQLPKPDPFFWFGELVPNTGCFVPNTNILVPGTGCFVNKKSEYFIAHGFHFTRGGTHYRITPMLLAPSVAKSLVESGIFNTDKIYTNIKGQPTQQKPVKDSSKKLKYMQRVGQVKKQLKKSEIRLIKKVLDDSKAYRFDKFTQKQYAKSKLKQFQKESKGRAKKAAKKINRNNDTNFAKEQQKIAKRSDDALLAKYKKRIKVEIITEGLSQAFGTTTEAVLKIRTQRLKTQAMISAGLLWQRGRRRKRQPKRPYTEMKPVYEFDGFGISGRFVNKRVVIEKPYGGYSQAGDPVFVKAENNRIEELFAKGKRKSVFQS